MAGIDTGTIQSGVYFQAKQFGSILRGSGPPVPQAGVVGDLYLDQVSFQLFTKRSPLAGGGLDAWGHYLFIVPGTYQAQLRWFSASIPDDSVGSIGDYCLAWAGFGNYGMSPVGIYGPKNAQNTWPENGVGPGTSIIAAGAGFAFPLGLLGEGPQAALSASTQLITAGLVDEYVASTPVSAAAGTSVIQSGLRQSPTSVALTINPLYTRED